MNRAEKAVKGVIGYKQFSKLYPNEEAAVKFLEQRRWGDTIRCPRCGDVNIYKTKSGDPHKPYRCTPCRRYFNVKTDTIFHGTQLPLRDWLYAIHLVQTSRKGVSSHQLSKQIECSQPAAWHLLARIRKAMELREAPWLEGIVEIDDTWMGGKRDAMHEWQRKAMGTDYNQNKALVMGFRVVGTGQVFAFPVARPSARVFREAVQRYVAPGSTVFTDGEPAYRALPRLGYDHFWINHKAGEYARGAVTTNGIESFWALLKRGYHGIYHHISPHHLRRYVNEFCHRLNAGHGNGPEAMGDILDGAIGRRLKWRVVLGREPADCLANA